METYDHVLLIDDNDIDNYLTKRVLINSKFTRKIDICTSGLDALNFIKNRLNNIEEIPDIIFLDLNMPVVNGFVFLFEWEDFPMEIKEKCRIIVLSGMIEKEIIDKISNNKYVAEFLPKPISSTALKRISANREKLSSKFRK
jgi:CheY-like chemotaxis protein